MLALIMTRPGLGAVKVTPLTQDLSSVSKDKIVIMGIIKAKEIKLVGGINKKEIETRESDLDKEFTKAMRTSLIKETVRARQVSLEVKEILARE